MRLRVTPGARALYLQGALVPITLRPLEGLARRRDEPGEDRVEADFLIDTGATHTVIEESLLHRLGLRPLRPAQFVVASGRLEERFVYKVRVELGVHDGTRPARMSAEVEVLGVDWSERGERPHDGLLGRDVLRNFRLHYDGAEGSIELMPVGLRS